MRVGTRRATEGDLRANVNEHYDRLMYGGPAAMLNRGTRFHDFGYWTAATRDPDEAGRNLVSALLEQVATDPDDVLDVACGMGATTAELAATFPDASVVGTNISDRQLESAREEAPGCAFLLMDATDLHFPDGSFDLVVCVEAAFHFDSREDFLREALRVLRPGGHLVLSDLLVLDVPRRAVDRGGLVPLEVNVLVEPREYEALLRRVGFDEVRVSDATEQCWRGWLRQARRFLAWQLLTGGLPRPVVTGLRRRLALRDLLTSAYVLVAARRPAEHRDDGPVRGPRPGPGPWPDAAPPGLA